MRKHKHQEKVEAEETAVPVEAPVADPATAAAPEEAPAAVEQAEAGPAAVPQEQAEIAALKDRYARLLADFDNYRKRQAREREDWIRTANEALLKDFLPVADHLQLALARAPDASEPFAAGVGLVYDQFIAALEKHGVTPLDATGQPFNPDWHEALSQVPSESVPEGGVVEQFRRGWCVGGRLMRPAQVIVSSGPAAAEEG